MPKKKKVSTYATYFDTLGFEWIFDISDYEKKKFWEKLGGASTVDFPIPRYAILRAKANPQRFPEIWIFESEIPLDDLKIYSEKEPQLLVDSIRRLGHCVYSIPREKEIIK